MTKRIFNMVFNTSVCTRLLTVMCLTKTKHAVKSFSLTLSFLLLTSCTTGRLEYVTPEGETKYACEVEYTWEPSVDKYAVEYILSHCAKQAAEKGNTVIQKELLNLDLSVPKPPKGKKWSFELAKSLHKQGQLTDKQYGYVIAHMDLGHDKH